MLINYLSTLDNLSKIEERYFFSSNSTITTLQELRELNMGLHFIVSIDINENDIILKRSYISLIKIGYTINLQEAKYGDIFILILTRNELYIYQEASGGTPRKLSKIHSY